MEEDILKDVFALTGSGLEELWHVLLILTVLMDRFGLHPRRCRIPYSR